MPRPAGAEATYHPRMRTTEPDAPTVTVDVAVVGGGLAGWTAATAAQEAGASVALVERGRRGPGWSNAIVSGGALHAVLRDPRTDPAELAAMITAATDGEADPVVVHAWATNAARSVAWAEAHGAVLSTDPEHAHRAKVFSPVRTTEPGMRWAGFGMAGYLTARRDAFVRRGGLLLQPARAHRLDRVADEWQLLLTARGPQVPPAVRAARVVLADGGFQASPALLRRHVGTDAVRVRGTGTGAGDGLRMGLANGGVAVHLRGFYGHLLARAALERDDLWPYPILDLVAAAGIVVTPRGVRLVDETIGGVTTTNEVAWSGHPRDCTIVVDDAAWQGEGRIGVTPPNPWLVEHGATVHTAPTLDALADLAGIEPTGLTDTVRGLMADPAGATPPRSGAPRLATPPFHAIPVVAGVTFTLGGLLVDAHARVVDAGGTPVPGLYAAGGTMGGLHGGPRVGYAGGLLEAAVFGLLAGEHAGR